MVKSSAKILFHNDNSDSIVASAGRISTTKGSAIEIYEKSCEKDITENINLIQKYYHPATHLFWSMLFKFGI